MEENDEPEPMQPIQNKHLYKSVKGDKVDEFLANIINSKNV